MLTLSETQFETFIRGHNDEAWAAILTTILRSIHEVERTAVQIWCAFYPLSLFQALQQAEDPETLARQLLLQGDYLLKNQIDTSHKFLYGHRYWPEVKKALVNQAVNFDEDSLPSLADQILQVARDIAADVKIDTSLLIGITAVGFMTIQQAGFQLFKSTPGSVLLDAKHGKRSPARILKERAKDNSQGILGFLRTVDKQWNVTYDENDDTARYRMNHMQDLAWGAASDSSRKWREIDPRRVEGPIPVECRSASCGTCWVGVLGGAEKLSDVTAREGKQIKKFGYIDTVEPGPLIRLACQAQAHGAVSIVIPPWNGVFGKYLREHGQSGEQRDR